MATPRSSSTPPALAGAGVQAKLAIDLAPEPEATATLRPLVEIRGSTRRRKTATAFYEGDKIVVLVPSRLRSSDREATAERLVNRLLNRQDRAVRSDAALAERAEALSSQYLGGADPRSIRWVTNQNRRWGSCTPATGCIRISHRLKVVPDWVLDSVIVHELAHLLETAHSRRFYELTARYPRTAEADAFLAGYSLGLTSGSWAMSNSETATEDEENDGGEDGDDSCLDGPADDGAPLFAVFTDPSAADPAC